jgi:hypothetical protein
VAEFGNDVVDTVEVAEHVAARKAPRILDASVLLRQVVSQHRSAGLRQVHRRIRADPGWVDLFTDWTQGLVDDEGADAVAQLRRETRLRREFAFPRPAAGPVGWHTSVVAGLRAALAEAEDAGVGSAGPAHLLAGLLRDPAGAMHGLSADRDELVAAVRSDPSWRQPGRPHTPLVSLLDGAKELSDRTGLRGRWDRKLRRAWIGDSRYRGGVTPTVLWEAVRQSVRRDDGPVTAAHLLLGVMELGWQLRLADRRLRPALLPFNGAPDVLAAHGVTPARAVAALPAVLPADPAVVPKGRAQLVIRSIETAWTVEAVDAVDRAVGLADAARHPATESSHLALAALDAVDGTAARLVTALDVDPAAVRADIATHLAQAPAEEQAVPSPGRRADRSPARARRFSP